MGDFLVFLLLRAVIVILMDRGTVAIMAKPARPPPAGFSGIFLGISRCTRRRGSFWRSALSKRGDIGHGVSGTPVSLELHLPEQGPCMTSGDGIL